MYLIQEEFDDTTTDETLLQLFKLNLVYADNLDLDTELF